MEALLLAAPPPLPQPLLLHLPQCLALLLLLPSMDPCLPSHWAVRSDCPPQKRSHRRLGQALAAVAERPPSAARQAGWQHEQQVEVRSSEVWAHYSSAAQMQTWRPQNGSAGERRAWLCTHEREPALHEPDNRLGQPEATMRPPPLPACTGQPSHPTCSIHHPTGPTIQRTCAMPKAASAGFAKGGSTAPGSGEGIGGIGSSGTASGSMAAAPAAATGPAAPLDARLAAGAGGAPEEPSCSTLVAADLLLRLPAPGGTSRSTPPAVQYRWQVCMQARGRAVGGQVRNAPEACSPYIDSRCWAAEGEHSWPSPPARPPAPLVHLPHF